MHTLILGIDSFDPTTFERLSSQGKMPNLARFADSGKYSRLIVSDPPQTEVSWTSIATGLNPGGHGIFDFVHRDPKTYTPFVSLLPTQRNVLGVQFVPPYKARTFFEEATRMGYPATSLWWPATFPARPESPVRTIPGLGTPDILGRLGVGTLFTTEKDLAQEDLKTSVKTLTGSGRDRYTGQLDGPSSQKRGQTHTVTLDLQLELDDDQGGHLRIGKQNIQLSAGKWSPILEVSFKMGRFVSVRALTRAILTQTKPEVRLYFLPLQIHPLASTWRYATPSSFVKEIWKACGPQLTLGWPQDTTGLEEGCISDDQFLDLCDSIFASREYTYMHTIDNFNEGVLAAVFDSLDRVQHMFRSNHQDIVDSWYLKLDSLVGRVEKRHVSLGNKNIKFMVLSDHGFSEFDFKVHLNRWLINQGYLKTNQTNGTGGLGDINWSASRAYGIGLNSLYANLENREGQGSLPPDALQNTLNNLRENLLSWVGPDGRPVVQRALLKEETFSGPYTPYGPDILIGYSPGYRASPETGLGKWGAVALEANNDHWGADHCIDSKSVPGVFFSNKGMEGMDAPSYRDIPMLAIGKELQLTDKEPPPPASSNDEDQETIEERLKSLGYL